MIRLRLIFKNTFSNWKLWISIKTEILSQNTIFKISFNDSWTFFNFLNFKNPSKSYSILILFQRHRWWFCVENLLNREMLKCIQAFQTKTKKSANKPFDHNNSNWFFIQYLQLQVYKHLQAASRQELLEN